jgi:alginate O-acetyltransferase complex protein AlgI
MLFHSYLFTIVYLPVVVVGFYFLARRFSLNVVLSWIIFSSFVFYGWHSIWNLTLFAGLCGIDLLVARYLVAENRLKSARITAFLIGLIGCMAPLGYFKYTDFFIENFNTLTASNFNFYNLILPLGISFFTFQRIGFLADCYNRKISSASTQSYFFFIFFFPQLIAGPIVHHSQIIPQLHKRSFGTFDAQTVALGVTVFTIGLFKKTVLADGIAPWSDAVFAVAKNGATLSFTEAWIGVLAYTFQIYFDFSGYSDMAIGIGLLFGLRLPINFWSPYKAVNIIDFWRRWHITLSNFLRDYVYFPLGGNRRGEVRRYLNHSHARRRNMARCSVDLYRLGSHARNDADFESCLGRYPSTIRLVDDDAVQALYRIMPVHNLHIRGVCVGALSRIGFYCCHFDLEIHVRTGTRRCLDPG